MTEKEFLEQYKKAWFRIIRITAELEELRTRAELPGYGLSGISVKSSPKIRMDDIVPAIADEATNLENELAEAKRIQREVRAAISKVRDADGREVLAYIYLCGYTIEQTSELMRVDPRTVCRKRNAALRFVVVPPINVVPQII